LGKASVMRGTVIAILVLASGLCGWMLAWGSAEAVKVAFSEGRQSFEVAWAGSRLKFSLLSPEVVIAGERLGGRPPIGLAGSLTGPEGLMIYYPDQPLKAGGTVRVYGANSYTKRKQGACTSGRR